nr:MAG TPA: hypothetical protein [Caudoviricetes sp.]
MIQTLSTPTLLYTWTSPLELFFGACFQHKYKLKLQKYVHHYHLWGYTYVHR